VLTTYTYYLPWHWDNSPFRLKNAFVGFMSFLGLTAIYFLNIISQVCWLTMCFCEVTTEFMNIIRMNSRFPIKWLILCPGWHAQAVSRWLPTAAARVRTRVRSCGFCGGESVTGAGFLRVFRCPLSILIPPIVPYSPSTIIGGWWSRPVVDAASPH
jgi:hypothetical protein